MKSLSEALKLAVVEAVARALCCSGSTLSAMNWTQLRIRQRSRKFSTLHHWSGSRNKTNTP